MSPMTTRSRFQLATTATNLEWHAARERARAEGGHLAGALDIDILPIAEAAGRTLAHDLFALTDLPHYSSSAMDGWAVNGDGPWTIGTPIRAGDSTRLEALEVGTARPIATGAPVPPGTTSIVRREVGETAWADGTMRLQVRMPVAVGRDIRHRGEEARRGEPLLLAGIPLTPARLALASVAGYDEISVMAAPDVDLVLLGDELRNHGLPGDGIVRDAFSSSLPTALTSAGARLGRISYGRDSVDATVDALLATTARLVVTTGGTARGPADFVRPALDAMGARIVCDGVAMRPGHPVLIARLDPQRLLLALPGNPLAAMLAFASVGVPLIEGMLRRPAAAPRRIRLAVAVENTSASTRLVACAWGADGAEPSRCQDSGMLRGLAESDLVCVVPPGGSRAGDLVEVL